MTGGEARRIRMRKYLESRTYLSGYSPQPPMGSSLQLAKRKQLDERRKKAEEKAKLIREKYKDDG